MPSLVIGNATFEIRHPETTLGRSEFCSIVLSGDDVGVEHASIEERNGALWILSLSRLCDVYVNGKRVRRHALKHQDHIKIGSHILRYDFYQSTLKDSDSLDERIDAYQRLYQFSYRIAEQLCSDELFEVILEEIVSLTKADHGVLVSLDNDEYFIRSTVDLTHTNAIDDVDTEVSESVIRQVMTTREALLSNDVLSDQEFESSQSILELGLCSVMCAPLIVQGELLGAIYVGSHKPQCFFQKHDLKTLCVFSAQAATLLKSARAQGALEEDNARLRQELEFSHFGEMIGSSVVMTEVYQRVERFSQAEINLLVTGETGTGKELIAREVHRRSHRHSGPFVSVNCGALPEGLVESELFGYREGAFTGAHRDKEGSFITAQGGTLFLDEIGELPLTLQVKLLRVVEERVVTPLGSNQEISLDVRLICATNVDLSQAITDGRFRQDLYYRLNVAEIHLPPLRDRGGDILTLAKFLIARFSERYQRPIKPLSRDAQRGLTRYSWPGNIRELENRISQALILSDGSELTLSDLNLQPTQLSESILSLREAQERFSRDYVLHILQLNHGNRSQAARDLGVDPRTVFRYLEREKHQESP
jgi:transcriptional regulator with GAF, ATPase, and Fis domain